MGGGVGFGGRGQSRCERRSEVFVKIQKNGGSGRGIWLGGRVGGGWSSWGGGGWGEVRVDVNEELKFCENSKKNWRGVW